MAENKELKVTPELWIEKRQPDILNILDSLKQYKSFTVPNPTENLNSLHTCISGIRGYQEYVREYLVKAISLELEVKRLLAYAEISLKDEIGKAFSTYAEVVSQGKSFEEKMLRLRQYIPAISDKEKWEAVYDSVKSFKEAVELVYKDLNSASMSIHGQIQVIRNQVLTGELKIRVGEFTAKAILSDNTLDAVEKASLSNIPAGKEFEL